MYTVTQNKTQHDVTNTFLLKVHLKVRVMQLLLSLDFHIFYLQ